MLSGSAIAAVLLAPLLAAPSQAPAEAPQPVAPQSPGAADWSELAARAGADRVSFAELDTLLLERFGTSERGREIAGYLAQRALIAHLAAEAGLRVGDAELEARVLQLDAEMQKGGVEGGLAGQLAEQGIEPAEFRATLRLAILHEKLTRRALGLPEGEAVSGDQQQIWIDAQLERLGLELGTPPFEDGIAARVGPVSVRAADLALLLRQGLEMKELREALMQILLLRRVEARLPGLTAEAYAKLVGEELARRRTEAESDPRFQGASFESLLAAQGSTLERLALDPAVRIAALSTHWIEREYDDTAVRAAYEKDRTFYEDHFGAAVHVRAIFLAAAESAGPLVKRTVAEAERTLLELTEGCDSPEAFAVLAAQHSEDSASRGRGGELGHLVRATRTLPKELTAELFDAEGGLFGPRRVGNGVVMLWVGAKRPSPPWETMEPHVRRELRRRFLMECLPPTEIQTYLDPGGLNPARLPAPPEKPAPRGEG